MTTLTLNQAQTTVNSNNLEQFFQEVMSNQNLQNKLKAATDLESLSQLVVALGEEYGYSFSIQEVQAASAVEAAVGNLWRADLDLRIKSIDFNLPSGSTLVTQNDDKTCTCCNI